MAIITPNTELTHEMIESVSAIIARMEETYSDISKFADKCGQEGLMALEMGQPILDYLLTTTSRLQDAMQCMDATRECFVTIHENLMTPPPFPGDGFNSSFEY